MKPVQKLFFFGILPALFFQVVAVYFYFLSDFPAPQWIYTFSKVFIFAWPLFWWSSLRKLYPPINGPVLPAVLKGLVLGLLMSIIIFTVAFFLKNTLESAIPAIREKTAQFHLTSAAVYLTFTVFLSVIHSLLEEYYWRCFVFRGLSLRFSWLKAALLGSAAFAAHHYLILSQFFSIPLTLIFGTLVGVGGLLWCAIYRKTNSLLAPWLSHAMVDASLMTVGYLLIF